MKGFLKKLAKDESAQGATEYILLLVAVVAMVALFRNTITEKVQDLIGKLNDEINQF